MPRIGVGNIATRFPRLKLLPRYVNQRRPSGCTKTKWKRLLAPLLVLLLLAMLAEFGGPLLSQTSRRTILAVLADPFSLLSERSPGLRGAGPLLSIKGKPHDRVLSGMRDRQPPVPNVVASIPIIPPQYDMTENQLRGLPPLTAANGTPGSAPEGLFANPPAVAATPPGTTAIPEPPSWTTVGGPLVVGLLGRQYVRKRRQA